MRRSSADAGCLRAAAASNTRPPGPVEPSHRRPAERRSRAAWSRFTQRRSGPARDRHILRDPAGVAVMPSVGVGSRLQPHVGLERAAERWSGARPQLAPAGRGPQSAGQQVRDMGQYLQLQFPGLHRAEGAAHHARDARHHRSCPAVRLHRRAAARRCCAGRRRRPAPHGLSTHDGHAVGVLAHVAPTRRMACSVGREDEERLEQPRILPEPLRRHRHKLAVTRRPHANHRARGAQDRSRAGDRRAGRSRWEVRVAGTANRWRQHGTCVDPRGHALSTAGWFGSRQLAVGACGEGDGACRAALWNGGPRPRWSVVFYAEDTRPSGVWPYGSIFGTPWLDANNALRGFPWSRMQVVASSSR